MTDTARRTRRQKVEARERAIVQATRAIFRERGADETRISEIARRAQVAEGTVYLYFENKKTLLLAAVTDFYDELTRDAENGVAATTGTQARLNGLADLHFRRVVDEWAMISEAMSPFLSAPDYRDSSAYALNRRYVAVFDRVLRDGMTAGDIRADLSVTVMRNAFYGGLEHCARTARLRPGPIDSGAEVEAFMSVFAADILPRGAAADPQPLSLAAQLRATADAVEDWARQSNRPAP